MTSIRTASRATQWRAQFETVQVRLQGLLAHPWLQRAILGAVMVWVFWDGIWAGVPRSDQIIYLHHISQYDSLWDILSHSPSWNRTLPDAGTDAILYRPVLYLLLGTLYYLFRYNFVAWQIASLSLHIVVALGLHLLLLQGRLKQSLLPLVITLLFATAYFASELVLWHHIVGYLLFCALEVYAIYFFLRFLQSDRIGFLIACGALTLIAEFTYEAGVIVNLLLAVALFGRSFYPPAAGTSPARSRRRADRWSALSFLLEVPLLPIASLADVHAHGFASAPRLLGIGSWQLILSAGHAFFQQIGFWFSAWLAPTVYRVYPAYKAIGVVSSTGLTGLTLLNLIALALLVAASVRGLRRLRHSEVSKREGEFALGLCMLFLLGYSMMIAIGRAVDRGFGYVQSNLYYSYVPYLTVGVAVALAAVVGRAGAASATTGNAPDSSRSGPAPGQSQNAAPPRVGAGFIAPLTILAFVNACGVRALTHQFRYVYAAPRQQVIDRVLAWHRLAGDRTQRYFVVSSDCPGNEHFGTFLLRGDPNWRPGVTLADALWPDWSADLNAAKSVISRESVDEIRCEESSPPK